MSIYIANILGLLGSLIMVYSGIIQNKKKILLLEIIEISLFAVSDLILGGISGTIVNSIGILINVLCYKEKLNAGWRIIITILTIIVSIVFNRFSILGIMLTIAMLVYLWFMNTKNIKHFKFLLIFYMFIWFVYDYSIQLYVSAVFDFLTIVMNIVSIRKIDKKVKNNKNRDNQKILNLEK